MGYNRQPMLNNITLSPLSSGIISFPKSYCWLAHRSAKPAGVKDTKTTHVRYIKGFSNMSGKLLQLSGLVGTKAILLKYIICVIS